MLEADQPIFERLACRKPVCGNIAALDSMLKTRP
jgi:hypothetical protein